MGEDEEDLVNLRRKFTEILKGFSHLGVLIERKSKKMLTQLETPEIDISGLDNVRIKIRELLIHLKQNSEASLLDLDQDIDSINPLSETPILQETTTENTTSDISANASTKVNINIDSTAVTQVNQLPSDSSASDKSLSLKRGQTDASQTDDEQWKDTLSLQRMQTDEMLLQKEHEQSTNEEERLSDTSRSQDGKTSEKSASLPEKRHDETGSEKNSDRSEICERRLSMAINESNTSKSMDTNDISRDLRKKGEDANSETTLNFEEKTDEDKTINRELEQNGGKTCETGLDLKETILEEDYQNPYSVETQKLSSDEEEKFDPHEEHNYSCPSSENDDAPMKEETLSEEILIPDSDEEIFKENPSDKKESNDSVENSCSVSQISKSMVKREDSENEPPNLDSLKNADLQDEMSKEEDKTAKNEEDGIAVIDLDKPSQINEEMNEIAKQSRNESNIPVEIEKFEDKDSIIETSNSNDSVNGDNPMKEELQPEKEDETVHNEEITILDSDDDELRIKKKSNDEESQRESINAIETSDSAGQIEKSTDSVGQIEKSEDEDSIKAKKSKEVETVVPEENKEDDEIMILDSDDDDAQKSKKEPNHEESNNDSNNSTITSDSTEKSTPEDDPKTSESSVERKENSDNSVKKESADKSDRSNSIPESQISNRSDSDTEISANYVVNEEHNYSSSESPQRDGADSDEIDIDRPTEPAQSVKPNESDGSSLMVGNSGENVEKIDDATAQFVRSPDDDSGSGSYEFFEDVAKDLENCLKSAENGTIQQEEDNHGNEQNEDLLDVTLEEFLSDGEGGNTQKKGSQDTNIYDISAIKVENIEIKSEEIDITEVKVGNETEEKEPDVKLELLKAEPQESVKEEDPYEVAYRILLDLEEDESGLSSSTDSDSVSDLSTSSLFSDGSGSVSGKDDSGKMLREYGMFDCYVPLERIEMSAKDKNKFSKDLDDDIDWLCDLKNLSAKRKQPKSPSFDKQRKKKLKQQSSSDSDSTSLTDSSSDDDYSTNVNKSIESNLDISMRQKLDEILANAICSELKSGSETSVLDSDDSDTSNSGEKKKNVKNDKHQQLSKEELAKKAWRKDALLTGKLSDSDSEVRRKKGIKRRYEQDSDFNVDSEHYDSDSDLEDMRQKNESKLEGNEISPIKRNIPDSDSSDSDSDVQYVSPKKAKREENEGQCSQKGGRRQIRSILSDRDLAIETIRAKKEEIERIERIKDRRKVIESLSQSYSSQQSDHDDVMPLILDMDEKTGRPLIEVNPTIAKKMKPHQKDGVRFMWDSCYESVKRLKKHDGSGCILAHCMGLGKTFQVLALIHTLFAHDETNTKHVLVVCPLSTVNNWMKEVKFAFGELLKDKGFSVFALTGTKKKRHPDTNYAVVKKWHLRKKALLVLGYECFEKLTNHARLDNKVSENSKDMILKCLVDPGPDLVICDEGHLIKNKKALKSLALHKIRTSRRIVLTGTPLQNNLIEYHHMVDFVKPNLLGNTKEFKTNFVNPITNGQFEDSNDADINLMRRRTHVLHKILTKTVQRVEDTELEIYLPPMLDHAVFIQLHQVQADLYNYFSDSTRQISRSDRSHKNFFSDFLVFQHICTHPQLLVFLDKNKNRGRKETDTITNEEDQPVFNLDGWWKNRIPLDADQKIEYGNKLVVLKAIIEECEAVGDKLLVFSQSLVELDLIEYFLKTKGTRRCPSWAKGRDYYRMDGTVPPDERSIICDKFNDERNNARLLIMSTRVGGLGLTLTAANRVVIMTVNWNPSYDTQSVFRVYRFGQKKQVYVYRLISLGTMEEKVYQRSVTKLAIAHRVVDKHQITRHYKSIDLQELYSCRPNTDSERPTPIVPDDKLLANVILKHSCVYKYHEHKALLADRPEDKLSEQEMAAAWEDFKNKDTPIPPPLPPPQQDNPLPDGPTFNMAYNLGRPNYDVQPNLDPNRFSSGANRFPNQSTPAKDVNRFPNQSTPAKDANRFPNQSIPAKDANRFTIPSIPAKDANRFPIQSISVIDADRFPTQSIPSKNTNRFPNQSITVKNANYHRMWSYDEQRNVVKPNSAASLPRTMTQKIQNVLANVAPKSVQTQPVTSKAFVGNKMVTVPKIVSINQGRPAGGHMVSRKLQYASKVPVDVPRGNLVENPFRNRNSSSDRSKPASANGITRS